MLATLLLRDSDDRDGELRRRLDAVRPLLLARRAVALGGVALTLAAVVGPLPIPLTLLALLLAAGAVSEAEIAAVRRAREVATVDRRLTAFAFAYASLAGLATLATGGAEIAGVLAFVLVIAGSGRALSARPLAAVTAYSLALFSAEVMGEWLGVIPAEVAPSRTAGALGSMLGTGHDAAEAAAVLLAVVALPSTALVTFVTTRRAQRAEREARLAATELRLTQDSVTEATESREQSEVRREAAEEEARRKAQELEEQNRSLATINAVSFALGGRLDEEDAAARAAGLIARIIGMRVVQLYVAPTEDQPAEQTLVAVGDDVAASGLSEALMERVSERGEPVFHSAATLREETAEQAERLPPETDAFAVVPLVANGRPIGAFAAIGVRPQGWRQDERQLLLSVGREIAVALENARLYRDALDRARQEALLSDVVRVVGATEDIGRAATKALELVATRVGATHAAMLSCSPGGRRPEVIAQYGDSAGGAPAGSAMAGALFAAPAMISDRTRPLMFGERGEASVSAALQAEEVSSLVLAPVVCADTGETDAPPSVPDTVHVGRGTGRQTIAAVLFVAAGPGTVWGRRHTDLLARLASVLARRLETETLLALKQRRISELSGLAEVATTVQSTIDPERLHSGFARAMHTLVPVDASCGRPRSRPPTAGTRGSGSAGRNAGPRKRRSHRRSSMRTIGTGSSPPCAPRARCWD